MSQPLPCLYVVSGNNYEDSYAIFVTPSEETAKTEITRMVKRDKRREEYQQAYYEYMHQLQEQRRAELPAEPVLQDWPRWNNIPQHCITPAMREERALIKAANEFKQKTYQVAWDAWNKSIKEATKAWAAANLDSQFEEDERTFGGYYAPEVGYSYKLVAQLA